MTRDAVQNKLIFETIAGYRLKKAGYGGRVQQNIYNDQENRPSNFSSQIQNTFHMEQSKIRDSKRESAKLFVGNLSYKCTEGIVRTNFEPFGTIVSIRMAMDRETGRPKG